MIIKQEKELAQDYQDAGIVSERGRGDEVLYLALRNVSAKWDTIQNWKQALNHFQLLWGDRIQAALNR